MVETLLVLIIVLTGLEGGTISNSPELLHFESLLILRLESLLVRGHYAPLDLTSQALRSPLGKGAPVDIFGNIASNVPLITWHMLHFDLLLRSTDPSLAVLGPVPHRKLLLLLVEEILAPGQLFCGRT